MILKPTVNTDAHRAIAMQAMGRKRHAGDVGFEKCKSGSQFTKDRQKQRQEGKVVEPLVGYSNISLLGGFIKLQQDDASGRAAS